MLESRLFEIVDGFEVRLSVEGRMCQNKKIKNIYINLLGCRLFADKQLVGHLKTHISHIIYSKFKQLCTNFLTFDKLDILRYWLFAYKQLLADSSV
jgi:hypothetical protein